MPITTDQIIDAANRGVLVRYIYKCDWEYAIAEDLYADGQNGLRTIVKAPPIGTSVKECTWSGSSRLIIKRTVKIKKQFKGINPY